MPDPSRIKQARPPAAALLLSFLLALYLSAEDLPKVLILETGGSIAASVEFEGADRIRFGTDKILERIPRYADYARVDREEFSRVGSAHVQPPQWIKLARRINRIFAEDPHLAGIVVTHGSNTVEETAYFLHLTANSDRPVVITASQRKLDAPSTDGPRNLLDSIRVAAARQARGLGVLLVANETIQSARDVTKVASYRVDTWQSRDLGNLGYIDRDQVTFYRRPTRKHTHRSEFRIEQVERLPQVEILYNYSGAGGELLSLVREHTETEAFVLATFPTGRLTPGMEKAARAAAEQGLPIVLAHRGGVGRVEKTSREFIAADNLTPQKARILLMLALTKTRDRREIQRIFDEY